MRALYLLDPLLQSRKKARELGEALHCSREQVYARAAGLGISLAACSSHAEMLAPPRDLLRDVDMDYVVERLQDGATMEAVSDEVGCCPRTLQRLMREIGIDSRHDIKWSDVDIEEAILKLRETPGFRDIGVSLTHGMGPRI